MSERGDPVEENQAAEPDEVDVAALYQRPDWRLLAAIAAGTIIGTFLVRHAPLLGHDWRAGLTQRLYPPWIFLLYRLLRFELPLPLSVAVLQGMSLFVPPLIAFRDARTRYPNHRMPAVAAVLAVLVSPLPWMMVWLGQIEVWVLVGLVALPFGIPLLWAKPHIGAFAAINTDRNILVMGAMVLVSVAIWGIWPLATIGLAVRSTAPPISMGWGSTGFWWTIPLGFVMLLLTDRNPLRLMAAGLFISPYLAAYHLYMLLPAVGQVRGPRQLGLYAASFLPLLVAGIPVLPVKLLALAHPLLVWTLLAPSFDWQTIRCNPDTLFNRLWAYRLLPGRLNNRNA